MSSKIEESKGKMIDEPTGIWPTNKDQDGDYYYTTSLNSFPGYVTADAGSHLITSKENVGFLVMENGGGWPYVTGWGGEMMSITLSRRNSMWRGIPRTKINFTRVPSLCHQTR